VKGTENHQVAQPNPRGCTNITLSARERLDLNISTTFVELAITSLTMLGKEGEQVLQKARGTYAPYQIRNRTGLGICIWSDIDGSSSANDASAVKILHDQTVDWRFDDWRTMREVKQFSLASQLPSAFVAARLFRPALHRTSIHRHNLGTIAKHSRRPRRGARVLASSPNEILQPIVVRGQSSG